LPCQEIRVLKLSKQTAHQTLKTIQRSVNLTLMAISAASLIGACSTAQQQSPQQTQQALQDLCATKDLSNTKQRALLAGGYHAIEKNDLVCAERLTSEARKQDPKDAYAALNLGAIYQRTGRLLMARAEYEQAIKLDSNAGKDASKQEPATVATFDKAKNKTPGDIAQRNLERLSK
jgi:Flp pilus assembly protein TadD